MFPRRKTLVLFICFFLIAFKVAASSIFIQAAIERAELTNLYASGSISLEAHKISELRGNDEQVHTLYLMSHVTANISEIGIAVFSPPITVATFSIVNEVLFSQNFPDSAFKPPKVTT